jgi:hypothetical protein
MMVWGISTNLLASIWIQKGAATATVACLHRAVAWAAIPIQGVPIITTQGLMVYAIATDFPYKESTVGWLILFEAWFNITSWRASVTGNIVTIITPACYIDAPGILPIAADLLAQVPPPKFHTLLVAQPPVFDHPCLVAAIAIHSISVIAPKGSEPAALAWDLWTEGETGPEGVRCTGEAELLLAERGAAITWEAVAIVTGFSWGLQVAVSTKGEGTLNKKAR